MGDPNAILETLRAMGARKHQVYILQVLDPAERDLSFDGPVLFESLETSETLRCEAALIRRAYREEFDRQAKLYDLGFHRAAIPHMVAYTDVPWERTLSDFLSILGKVG
jgi:hypothetical protein